MVSICVDACLPFWLIIHACGRTRNRQKRESKCFVILNIKLNQFTALEGKDIKDFAVMKKGIEGYEYNN